MTEKAAAREYDDPRVYVRILTLVREQISDGTLKPGARTPPINEFCRQFGCARHTAGKAMRVLAKEGLIVRYPGLGYYVARGPAAGGPISGPQPTPAEVSTYGGAARRP
ncbi:MAG TPA: winged helix-turn-helix domain-containing protein [Trebonia sp.]